MRVFGEKTELVIDRVREEALMDQLLVFDIGTPLFGRFSNGRVEHFLEGRSLTPDEMTDEVISPLVGAAMAKLHSVWASLVASSRGECAIAHDSRAYFLFSGCCRSSWLMHRRHPSSPRLSSGFRRKCLPSDSCVYNAVICVTPVAPFNLHTITMIRSPRSSNNILFTYHSLPLNAFDLQDDQPERAALLASIDISRIADEVVEMKRILLV